MKKLYIRMTATHSNILRPGQPIYHEGTVYHLEAPLAQYFLRLGAAVRVADTRGRSQETAQISAVSQPDPAARATPGERQ